MTEKKRPRFIKFVGQVVIGVIAASWGSTISSGFNVPYCLSAYFFVLSFISLWKWWGPGVLPAGLVGSPENSSKSTAPRGDNPETHPKHDDVPR